MTEKTFEGDFDADVPAHLREDVLQRICECGYGRDHKDPDIEIIDFERHDQINIEFTGTILIEGVEHWFHIRDGDRAGTEILGWNNGGSDGIHREPPVERALVPRRNAVENAIFDGRAAVFLEEWNADLDPSTERGRVLHDLPRKAAYDAHFAPGSGATRVHYETARRHGYEIGDADEARALRKRLHAATLRFRPASAWPLTDPAEARAVFERWSQIGTEAAPLIDRVADRLSRTRFGDVCRGEQVELRALGFEFVTRGQEAIAWKAGLPGLFRLEPIEGFDPAMLPEDPIKGVLKDFFRHTGENPGFDARVDPAARSVELLWHAFSRMAFDRTIEFPEGFRTAFEEIGFRVVEQGLEAAEPAHEEAPRP
ncbi:hypothetical protein LAZ40_06635 [Cereibacter sphaeroides]|uniref:hypothetical protein n=1 Tax=Cereibacter sphaeroides TaxID=1063 RepID=UPI001F31C4CF|nr:hypothetical protein [Cereibacter sphaeroides]MCE6958722.1 hypothetical protein [Cereibacter sphaeroides]MCE6971210.1 hypothetical protein [Cereibacter sphaeroides]